MSISTGSPRRPYVELLNGRLEVGKRAYSDLTRDEKANFLPRVTGRDTTHSTVQTVHDLAYMVDELKQAVPQIEAQADDLDRAADVLDGNDVEISQTDDGFGIIDTATKAAELAQHLRKIQPDFDLADVGDLAADLRKAAAALRRDVSVGKSRVDKLEEFLETAVLNALSDDATDDNDFEDIRLNTKAGRALFADFDISPSDFHDEWKALPKEAVALNDEAGGLRFLHVRMPDGSLLTSLEYKRLRYREAVRLIPAVMREQKAAERRDRKAAGKQAELRKIKDKLSEVWK